MYALLFVFSLFLATLDGGPTGLPADPAPLIDDTFAAPEALPPALVGPVEPAPPEETTAVEPEVAAPSIAEAGFSLAAFAIATGAIGLAVWGVVQSGKKALAAWAPRVEAKLNPLWLLLSVLLGVGIAWIPGVVDMLNSLADLSLDASPGVKIIAGLVGGGGATATHKLVRKLVKGKLGSGRPDLPR